MLENFKADIERLIARYEGELQERKRLEAALEDARTRNEALRKQITDLEREVDNLKLTGAFTSPEGGNAAAREKIDGLIREIDKCIALLQR